MGGGLGRAPSLEEIKDGVELVILVLAQPVLHRLENIYLRDQHTIIIKHVQDFRSKVDVIQLCSDGA